MDRNRIDWSAALNGATSARERAFIEGLRRLGRLRGDPPRAAEPLFAWPWTLALGVVTAVAAAQTVCGLVVATLAATSGVSFAAGSSVHLVLALGFALASLVIGPAALRDNRAFLLLATFLLSASAFAHPLLQALPQGRRALETPLFRGLYPEAFAAAALSHFAAVFPSVLRFTPVDHFARRAAMLAWTVTGGLVAVNLLLAYDRAAPALTALERDHPGNLYWRLFAAAALPSLAVILIRAHRAPRVERLKVARFTAAIAAGAGPFLLAGAARSVPQVNEWVQAVAVRAWLDPLVLGSLAILPVVASVTVLVDEPFQLSSMSGAAHPTRRLRLRIGNPVVFLRPRRLRERLAAALDQVRCARGARELLAVLDRELLSGLRASAVTIVEPGTLPRDTALLPLLAEVVHPIDLSRGREPFVLLPRHDRAWIEARGLVLAAAIRLRDGPLAAIVLLGPPRGRDGFTRAERWFIEALLLATSAAWPAPGVLQNDEPGDECERCGTVRGPGDPVCCDGAPTRLAALPRQLAGKYVVMRRLGAGGMGIVYLAHDRVLDRDVALKTLPALGGRAVAALRDEARAMGTLSHPRVATIYGVEIWRGTPVLVLEYFARGTLADSLRHGPRPLEEVLQLGIALTDALTHLHERGVLHRDVKPSNIGIAADGTPKLLDFGLVGASEPTAGTRAYLPPEVMDGATPDPGVDLWALAIVLRAASVPDAGLEALLARALAPRPEDRLRSSREMHAALLRLLTAIRRH